MQSELIYRSSGFAKGKGRLSLRLGIWTIVLLVLSFGIFEVGPLHRLFDSWINPLFLITGYLLLGLNNLTAIRYFTWVLTFRADRVVYKTPGQSKEIKFSPQASIRLLYAPGILVTFRE